MVNISSAQHRKRSLKHRMCSFFFNACPGFRKKLLNFLSNTYWLESCASVIRSAGENPENRALLQEQLGPGVLPSFVLRDFEEANMAALSYGQEGEDIVLRHLISKEQGFFVDVGAHHPLRFSNTWALYQRGWRGINIDATPGSMAAFEGLRPEDTNIEALISDSSGPVTFFSFEEPALNTLNAPLAQKYLETGCPLKERIKLIPQPLATLLDTHVPAGTQIDVMSVDVEEHELSVFKTNNWDKYKPTLLIVELLDIPIQALDTHPVAQYLRGQGYVPISKLCRSVFFMQE